MTSRPALLVPSMPNRKRHARLVALLLASALAPAILPLVPGAGAPFAIHAARAAQNVAIDKLEFSGKYGSIVLNGIEVTGSSLSRAEIEGIFKADSLVKVQALLAKLDAEKFAIKSIVATMLIDKQKTETVYDGFEAKGIKSGLIDRLAIRETRQVTTSPETPKNMTMKTGETSVEKLDLAGIFAFMTQADPTGKAPMKQLHGRYDMAPITMVADKVEIKTGKAYATGFKARLPRQPLVELIPLIEKMEKDKDDAATGFKVISAALDVYSSFEFGEGALEGMSIKGPDAKNGGEFTGNVGKMSFGGGAKPFFLLDGMEFKGKDGFFKLKKIAAEGDLYGVLLMSFQRVFESLPQSKDPKNSAQEAEFRKLLAESSARYTSAMVGYRLEGLELDVPPSGNAKTSERVKMSMAGFSTSFGSFAGFTPTKIDIALDAFKMPIPKNSKDDGLKNMLELGITEIDLSSKVKMNWDEPTTKLIVEDISVDMQKFGRFAMKGELGNIPRALLEDPKTNWPIAMMSANVQKLSFSLENKGGFEKLLEKTAKDQGKKPDQLRTEISTMAPAMIGAFMAAHPDAQALADALGKFTKGLGSLSVAARSATPAGIGAADVMAASQNPAALLTKVRFEASGK